MLNPIANRLSIFFFIYSFLSWKICIRKNLSSLLLSFFLNEVFSKVTLFFHSSPCPLYLNGDCCKMTELSPESIFFLFFFRPGPDCEGMQIRNNIQAFPKQFSPIRDRLCDCLNVVFNSVEFWPF